MPSGELLKMAPAQGIALRAEAASLSKAGFFDQPGSEHRFVVGRCIFVQLLPRLIAGCLFAKHLDGQLAQPRLIDHRPRNGRVP